jgi:hypothetical protein
VAICLTPMRINWMFAASGISLADVRSPPMRGAWRVPRTPDNARGAPRSGERLRIAFRHCNYYTAFPRMQTQIFCSV